MIFKQPISFHCAKLVSILILRFGFQNIGFRDISTHFTNLVALGVSHTLFETDTLFHNLWVTQKAEDLPPFPRKFVFDYYPLLSASKQAFLQGMVQAWFDAVLDKIGIDQPTMKFLETRFLARTFILATNHQFSQHFNNWFS